MPLGFFVVSIQAKSRFKRLHQIGSCHRRPGKDYGTYEALGADEPHTMKLDARCKDCFKLASTGVQHASKSSGSSSSESGNSFVIVDFPAHAFGFANENLTFTSLPDFVVIRK